jgi:SnoaL-like domain
MAMREDIITLVRRFYEQLWNNWDDAAVDYTLAPGFTFRGSLGQQTTGRSGWRAYRDHVQRGSSDFHNEIITLGDLHDLRRQLTGT